MHLWPRYGPRRLVLHRWLRLFPDGCPGAGGDSCPAEWTGLHERLRADGPLEDRSWRSAGDPSRRWRFVLPLQCWGRWGRRIRRQLPRGNRGYSVSGVSSKPDRRKVRSGWWTLRLLLPDSLRLLFPDSGRILFSDPHGWKRVRLLVSRTSRGCSATTAIRAVVFRKESDCFCISFNDIFHEWKIS